MQRSLRPVEALAPTLWTRQGAPTGLRQVGRSEEGAL
jgi:hypothetical protein